jgi:hypothetical protein
MWSTAMTSQIIFGTALPFINDPVQAEKAFSNAKGVSVCAQFPSPLRRISFT